MLSGLVFGADAGVAEGEGVGDGEGAGEVEGERPSSGVDVGDGEGGGEVEGEGVGDGDREGEGDGEGAGGLVSTLKVNVLFSSAPSVLAFPASSVKVPLATEITPLAVLLLVGVKVAE